MPRMLLGQVESLPPALVETFAPLALVNVPEEATPLTQLKVLLLELITEVARQVMLFRLLQLENISR